ncbi:hypothetical protein [Thiocapsa sp. N5-Cardenillas]|uniref:hypothetical protein n=1 Tax=Thiocapsa sp. N5-Cardenillas TaxID=3137397 RepID=UPI0035B25959
MEAFEEYEEASRERGIKRETYADREQQAISAAKHAGRMQPGQQAIETMKQTGEVVRTPGEQRVLDEDLRRRTVEAETATGEAESQRETLPSRRRKAVMDAEAAAVASETAWVNAPQTVAIEEARKQSELNDAQWKARLSKRRTLGKATRMEEREDGLYEITEEQFQLPDDDTVYTERTNVTQKKTRKDLDLEREKEGAAIARARDPYLGRWEATKDVDRWGTVMGTQIVYRDPVTGDFLSDYKPTTEVTPRPKPSVTLRPPGAPGATVALPAEQVAPQPQGGNMPLVTMPNGTQVRQRAMPEGKGRIGQMYLTPSGRRGVYLGGNPADPASWAPVD